MFFALTTFIKRPLFTRAFMIRGALIGLFLLLSSCSMLRMGYNQGPHLLWWWLDSYVDFTHEQTPHVKKAIRDWFDWHRSSQLPEYAAWLTVLSSEIGDSVTPDQVCGWSEKIRSTVAPALDYSLLLAAPLIPSLSEQQLIHIGQRYAKGNEEFRSDYLQPVAEERLQASVQRTVKRVENLYGKINETQRRLITDNLTASPFDPEAWLAERQRRQNETLSILRQLIAKPVETEHTINSLRTIVEHIERSSDTDYRTYQIKLTEYNCAFIAHVHNSTSEKQRQHAYKKLKSWEADLLILANDTP